MLRHPLALLWLLPLAALLAGLAAWASARRARLAALIGEPATLARLVPTEAARRRALKTWLQAAALGLLVVALAGPQWGVELIATQSAARSVIVVIDTSLSMTAEDIKPNRLEKAKSEMSLLLGRLRGSRVGVLAFAGAPGLVCPLTTDVEAAKQLLSGLEPGSIPVPGTAIGSALRAATAALARYPGGKAVVLLTDGEDHRTDPLGAAEEAAAQGVRVYAVGIGTPEGEPLPLKEPGSGALAGYKKDRKGATVISRLGEKTLAELAARTGGSYYRASASEDEIGEIVRSIEGLEKAAATTAAANQYKNRFMYPLALAFILLIIELLIPPSARQPSSRAQPARSAGTLVTTILMLSPLLARGASSESSLRQGNKLYSRQEYGAALERYRRAEKTGDPRPAFNAGDALYRLEEYAGASEAFAKLADPKAPVPKDLRADAYYNLGNALMRQGDAARAVEAYRQAVVRAPKDADARHNLAVALKMLKNPPPPQKKPQDPKKDKDEDQPKPQGGEKDKPQERQPAPRPQDRITKEDAERIMRSVQEKEKGAQRKVKQQPQGHKQKPPAEEDW